ncbi:MAG: hypothetical protein ACRERV_10205 [Methylococcales bacterium]
MLPEHLGSVDILSGPDEDGDKMEKAPKVSGGFLETRKDATIMFAFVEKAWAEAAALRVRQKKTIN